jgi:hypothetical protein
MMCFCFVDISSSSFLLYKLIEFCYYYLGRYNIGVFSFHEDNTLRNFLYISPLMLSIISY